MSEIFTLEPGTPVPADSSYILSYPSILYPAYQQQAEVYQFLLRA